MMIKKQVTIIESIEIEAANNTQLDDKVSKFQKDGHTIKDIFIDHTSNSKTVVLERRTTSTTSFDLTN